MKAEAAAQQQQQSRKKQSRSAKDMKSFCSANHVFLCLALLPLVLVFHCQEKADHLQTLSKWSASGLFLVVTPLAQKEAR